ncbi:MAG TPA: ATP-binding protein [Oligoflexus sp.]|uniref:globin domain-containing protein n=1 Tax=Oligoflexus sp. TaxID=1971216 RepID=UPI002D2DB1E4|nr:ATP-binding protein [Oligoflexus sp.]HYX32438.1 ATP-binding protein [Oligoflexus sp.]
MANDSLYDKYGGFVGISGVVHDFYKRIQKSESLQSFFAHTDMDKLIDHQIKFLCKVLGGPDNYEGRTLDRAHRLLKIHNQAFDEVGGHLKDALIGAGVEAQDVATILAVVESVRAHIVTVKDEDIVAAVPTRKTPPSIYESTVTVADKLPMAYLLDTAVAIVHPKTLSMTYANPCFLDWAGVDALPISAEEAFGATAFAEIRQKIQDGNKVIVLETESSPKNGSRIPLAYTLRLINWREGRYIVTGMDLSRVKEKDVMLKSYTQIIEVNNRKIKNEQRAVSELLDNMRQAVFTFTNDFKITARYSKFVHKLFGEGVEVAGRNAVDFIFEGVDIGASDRAKFVSELSFVFANDDFQWSISSMGFPKQIKKKIGDREFDIKLDFEAIWTDSTLSKIMVVMEDMTAFNQAKRDAELKTKELERVANLMAVNAEHFAAFEGEIWTVLDRATGSLKSLKTAVLGSDVHQLRFHIHELFRHIHTIKGNARSIQLKSVQEVAHHAEDHVSKLRDQGTAQDTDIDEIEKHVGFIKSEVEAYCALRKSIFGEKTATLPVNETLHTVELMQAVSQAHKAGGAALAEAIRNLDAHRNELGRRVQQSILDRHNAMIQDIAEKNGKKIGPVAFEGDIAIFAHYAKDRMNEIITHALRNSVDHGIEAPDRRKAKGKSETGRISIRFEVSEAAHKLIIADDGQGLQIQNIKKKAVEKHLVEPEAAAIMCEKEVAELLFLPGFSTASEVSDISGRGVGMDAVRAAARELGGTVTISSLRHGGTELVVTLPIKKKLIARKAG